MSHLWPMRSRAHLLVGQPGALEWAEAANSAPSSRLNPSARRGAVLVPFPARRSGSGFGSDRQTRVLFVCRSHAVLSPMAEGLAQVAYDRLDIDVQSAGLAARRVDPRAVSAMAEVGIDISQTIPTFVSDLDLADFDVVVSLGMHKLGLAREQIAIAWDVPEFTRVTDATALPRLRDLRAQLSVRVNALGAVLTATHRA